MPETEYLASVHTFFERVLNAGDYESLRALSHRDVLVPQEATGIDALWRHIAELRVTFSGAEYRVIDAVCEGEKVVVRFSAKAKHSGRYMGIPATGKALNLWGVMIFRFDAGSIAEFWSLVDAQGVLKQLRGQ